MEGLILSDPKLRVPLTCGRSVSQSALDERGSAMIEAALTIPIIILVLTAMLDLSQMIEVRSALNRAAAGAVKMGALYSNLETGTCTHVGTAAPTAVEAVVPFSASCPTRPNHWNIISYAYQSIYDWTFWEQNFSGTRFTLAGTSFHSEYIDGSAVNEPDTVKLTITTTYLPFFPLFKGQTISGSSSSAYTY